MLRRVPLYRVPQPLSSFSKMMIASTVAQVEFKNACLFQQQNRTFSSIKPLNVGGMSNDLLVSLSMNYNNSGSNHTELCDNLRRNNLISTPLIEYSFRKADRAIFDPSEMPYEDKPHSIGGDATITSAHMHAIALESIAGAMIHEKPSTDLRFLDIGSGSGYVAGVMGVLIHTMTNSAANKEINNGRCVGHVIGVDVVPQLVEQSKRNLLALMPNLTTEVDTVDTVDLTVENSPICHMICMDAFKDIVPSGPFDAIHVGVACIGTPYKLLSQLKVDGKAVIPIYIQGTPEQDLLVFTRKGDTPLPETDDIPTLDAWFEANFTKKLVMRCMYSPPIDADHIPESLAIDPRGEIKTSANSKFSKFFKNDGAVRETPEAAAQRRKQAKAQEMSETRLRVTAELEKQKKAFDQTSSEVKAWHANYFAQHNKHPTMAEMKQDPTMDKLLTIVHELRRQIEKNERGLEALNH